MQHEAKPATPRVSSLGLAQMDLSRPITEQTHSTSCKEEEGTAETRRWGAHGHVQQHQSPNLGTSTAQRVAEGSVAHGRELSQRNSANLHFCSRAEDEAAGFRASAFPPAL